MSMLSVIKAKLGQAANTAYNFLFDASAADGTLKLVRENGQQVMTVDVNGKVSFPQGTSGGLLTMSTAQTTTSGTSVDFADVPAWVNRITVVFGGISLSGGASLLVQLGTASGIENTGYASSSIGTDTSTSGFVVRLSEASRVARGHMIITRVSGNSWVSSHTVSVELPGDFLGGGTKALSGQISKLRLTSTTGTDTFDAGAVNLIYEG